MAYEDLKLIKCFRFDKDEKHWDMCDEWMSKYRVEVGALHTFAHGKNEAYIATTRYSADGESDGISVWWVSKLWEDAWAWAAPIARASERI